MSWSDQLRWRLRAETRPHQRVNDAFKRLDVGRASDLASFLGAQLVALRALIPQSRPDRSGAETVAADMSAAIAADLRALGAEPAPTLALHRVDATAVLYVLRASRMGMQMLARRWKLTSGAEGRGAGRYLSLDPQKDCLCALYLRLEGRPAYDAAANKLAAQVAAVFDLYSAALVGVLARAKEPAHV